MNLLSKVKKIILGVVSGLAVVGIIIGSFFAIKALKDKKVTLKQGTETNMQSPSSQDPQDTLTSVEEDGKESLPPNVSRAQSKFSADLYDASNNSQEPYELIEALAADALDVIIQKNIYLYRKGRETDTYLDVIGHFVCLLKAPEAPSMLNDIINKKEKTYFISLQKSLNIKNPVTLTSQEPGYQNIGQAFNILIKDLITANFKQLDNLSNITETLLEYAKSNCPCNGSLDERTKQNINTHIIQEFVKLKKEIIDF